MMSAGISHSKIRLKFEEVCEQRTQPKVKHHYRQFFAQATGWWKAEELSIFCECDPRRTK